MNRRRREELRDVLARLDLCRTDIDRALWEEEDSRDNMPENLEYSDQYEKMDHAVDCLEDAMEDMDSLIKNLEDAIF